MLITVFKYYSHYQLSLQQSDRIMAGVSQDVFFKVKKDILDKLDLILQKMNLSIIRELKPQRQFDFIQLSTFQQEIDFLFSYLDRLYASLNSSVSFSSIASFKSNCESYALQNARLKSQNIQLRAMITKSIALEDFNYFKEQINVLSQQYSHFSREIEKQLKAFKFQLLERRVETIAKIKNVQNKKCDGKCKDLLEVEEALNEVISLCMIKS